MCEGSRRTSVGTADGAGGGAADALNELNGAGVGTFDFMKVRT